jgi:TetR/AcrR family transcriptional regulator
MYEGLIEFVESSVFTLANKIAADETDGRKQAAKLVEMLLAFAEKNPGMVRVMTGDALVGEHERLQARMNQFYERFEATLKQALRAPGGDGGKKPSDAEVSAQAGSLMRYLIGGLHQYAKSGFAKKPTDGYAAQRQHLAF